MKNTEKNQKPVIVKGKRYAFSGDIENGNRSRTRISRRSPVERT